MLPLSCPVCTAAFDRPFVCARGHGFDVARQGYVNLLAGRDPGTGDSAEMVAARTEFLATGHYAPIAALLTGHDATTVVEVGAGTGYYISRVLDGLPGAEGLALDLSKFAARRAARAHPRLTAAVADCWGRLPLLDDSVDLLLDVFAPRNPAEFARILRPTGTLLVVTPLPAHLAELRATLGLIDVDPDKDDRVAQALNPYFVPEPGREVQHELALTRQDVANLVGMGPSARHTAPAAGIAALAEPVAVTLAVRLGVYRLR